MRWDATDLRVGLPIGVGRHSNRNDGLALGEIKRKLRELRRLNRRNAVLGQQIVDHLGILYADEEAEHAEHARRHAEIETDAVGMPGPRSGARTDDHFVTRQVLDHFLDERKYRSPPAVDETLASDLDDVGIGQDLDDGLLVEQSHLRLIGGACAHQSDRHAVERLAIHFRYLPFAQFSGGIDVTFTYCVLLRGRTCNRRIADPYARAGTVLKAFVRCITVRPRHYMQRGHLRHVRFGHQDVPEPVQAYARPRA